MTLLSLIVDGLLLVLTLVALWFGVRLHALLRTGEVGYAWRFVVLGTLLLVLKELVRLGDQLGSIPWLPIWERIAEAGFLVMLCYALWRQWAAFDFRQRSRTRYSAWAQRAAQLREEKTDDETIEERGWRWRIL
ncbi:hypothetical protein HRbin17_01308 [bacterium HR17]|uniref:Uncharacterized protein n=1 Tax=Candidatus Fervidibacter japonicus TaxID=2035412 RepID=A0A2H5XCA3_9BACT|nr:hypothetical protein HRbin17_01308 [bacterium HR17]